MRGRTVRNFVYKGNLWPVVDAWAAEAGFTLLHGEASRRVYRKGKRLLMAPAFLEICHEQGQVRLEAWVKADLLLVTSILTGKGPETPIESGGLTASVPRRRAREAVNVLLQRLAQKSIS